MARSVGNISRVVDLLEAGVNARALRYALISVHYRQGIDYSDASLDAAGAAIDRLDALVAALEAYQEERADAPDLPGELDAARTRFEAALDDDLNVSAALAALFDLVRALNRHVADRALSSADAATALACLRDLDSVLGVLPDVAEDLPAGAADLLAARASAREGRDFAASDRLRDELLALGVAVEDTRDGQRWRRLEAVR
jgi:cysteinyl-tRNA synthetase